MSTSSAATTDSLYDFASRVLFLPKFYDDKNFAVDETDFLVVRQLLLGIGIREDEIPTRAKKMVDMWEYDKERRFFQLAYGNRQLPEEIGNLTRLRTLNLRNSSITLLPSSFGKLKNLTYLDLSSSKIASLPPSIGQLQSLEYLQLGGTTNLLHLPGEIWNLTGLKLLYLSKRNLLSLPEEIGNLISLKFLSLRNSSITSLPSSFGKLKNLTYLDLSSSKIASLPPSIGQLQSLETLDLNYTMNLLHLPEEIWNLTGLEFLYLSKRNLVNLPEEIGNLIGLKYLSLSYSSIASLPSSIGKLKNLTDLDLTKSKIASLPPSIGQLKSLETLDLDDTTNLLHLPEEIWNLTGLKALYLSKRNLVNLPEEIGNLTRLRTLNLSYSSIASLPSSFGKLKNLGYLDLTKSKIVSLPPSIGQLKSLKVLDLTRTTNLLHLPEEIGNLTNLRYLGLPTAGIKLMPDSIGRLKSLTDLEFPSSADLLERASNKFLLMLVKHCKSLCSICCGHCMYADRMKLSKELNYALACKRARIRTGIGFKDKKSPSTTPKLWPRMLNRATHAFDWLCYFECECPSKCPSEPYVIEKPDAIYQLLDGDRESFIRLLVNRHVKDGS